IETARTDIQNTRRTMIERNHAEAKHKLNQIKIGPFFSHDEQSSISDNNNIFDYDNSSEFGSTSDDELHYEKTKEKKGKLNNNEIKKLKKRNKLKKLKKRNKLYNQNDNQNRGVLGKQSNKVNNYIMEK